MNETYYKTYITKLINTQQELREQRENFRSEDMCHKHDSCIRCRNARLNSPEYMELLQKDNDISILVRKLTYKLDKSRYSQEYLSWKYGSF